MKPRELEALLDAERRAPDPPPETRARVFGRVEATVGLAAAATVATAATAKAATGAQAALAATGKALALKIVIGAVGAALLGGGAYIALQHKSPQGAALSPSAESRDPVVTPRPPPQVFVVPRQMPPKPRPPQPTMGLADEQAFLEEARAALRNGSPQRALQLLSQHERSFPAGQLGDARDSLVIQALVAEGRTDAARARAAEFRRRHPHSLFQPAVDASLAR